MTAERNVSRRVVTYAFVQFVASGVLAFGIYYSLFDTSLAGASVFGITMGLAMSLVLLWVDRTGVTGWVE